MALGDFFKQQRLANGLTISDISHGIISESQISRFERNETDLNVATFFELLQKFGSDMETWQMTYMATQSQSFIQGLDIAASKGPDAVMVLANSLHEKWVKTGNPFNRYASIATRAALPLLGQPNVVTSEEVSVMKKYFETVNTWGMFDLAVLNMMTPLFDLDLLLNFGKVIAMDKPSDLQGLLYRGYRILAVYKIIDMLVRTQRFEDAESLWTRVKNEPPLADEIGINLRHQIYALSFRYRHSPQKDLATKAAQVARVGGVSGKALLGNQMISIWQAITGVKLNGQ
ncbi:helix-turn-helix domain-containing protein [Lacticaseibacillus paracasei]|uniref:helix-turn-helix domain-containing protein n=1 Tax=Lacticaseibacillus paracasei TaxID=1597 RepID=UPI0018917A61|nr:helix-turn-helix transcriptional regulator [Lacticaseibacillus paracasei]QPB56097.1 helix-turn-helix domain-containing protein [Lacticaseibacillus paracasei]WPQ31168.1 helix-turn-helix transcriptional regulator [Lacticaseibacillus paracasei]